jgi:hypothetical protein
VFDKTFWDLFLQKCFRNVASVKYQWMLLLYVPVIWGMFHINEKTSQPWISAAVGLGFLGGGFITLATTRIIARTKLREDSSEILDTDK